MDVRLFSSPYDLPELSSGQVFVIPWPEYFSSLSIDGKRLTKVKGNLAIGSLNVSGPPVSVLQGAMPLERGHTLRSPSQKLFIQRIPVHTVNKEKPRTLRLPASVIEKIKSAEKEQIDKESQTLKQILTAEKLPINTACWKKPIRSKVVSSFGSPRVLPDNRFYFHSGLDMRAWTDTPVYAAGPGVVVYDQPMVISGNQIIIDHGGGIFTRYLHLNRTVASVGDTVKAGVMIGYSGSTGRAEAPHLHWEVIWKGRAVDPLQFLDVWKKLCDG